jgi:hypothetical protein
MFGSARPNAALLAHLRAYYPSHATASTYNARQEALAQMLKQPWADPTREPGLFPPLGKPPVPGLPVYQGRGCPHCPYIGRTTKTMEKHRRVNYKDKDGYCSSGRLSRAQARARAQQPPITRLQHIFGIRPGNSCTQIAKLRREDNVLPLLGVRTEPRPQQVFAVAVNVRGIPEALARGIEFVQEGEALCIGKVRTLEGAQAHHAIADGGYKRAVGAEGPGG